MHSAHAICPQRCESRFINHSTNTGLKLLIIFENHGPNKNLLPTSNLNLSRLTISTVFNFFIIPRML